MKVAPRLPAVAFLERRSRRQRMAALIVVVVYLAWRALRLAATVVLDRWWYDTVTDASVWSTRVGAQALLAVAAGALVLAVVGGSVWIAFRDGRRPELERHRLIERYHQRVGPAHHWALLALVAYVTWRAGSAAAGSWQQWLLFRHGGDLGEDVPRVGRDLGFFLFRLPFVAGVSELLRTVLLVALAVTAFAGVASGAIRWPGGGRRWSPVASLHLAVLAALLLAAHAAHLLLVARPSTALSRTGSFDGAGYTEVTVVRPAMLVAAVSAVALGFAVIVWARSGRWRPAAAIAAIAVAVHAVGLVALPSAVERFVVAPAVAERQLWSIDANLAATRAAYGLDAFETDGSALEAAAPELPVFGEAALPAALQVLTGTPGTRISDVDVVELAADGEPRLVYTAARTPSRDDLPESGWVQEHLVYTHGDGVTIAAADRADGEGRPVVLAADAVDGAAAPLYYGEGLDGWYAITATRRDETGGVTYTGPGIAMGSLARRTVLALAGGDPQPLLSSELTARSQLLYRRGLGDRLGELAPFLTFDPDPYAVVSAGHVVWIVDGYTTASTYPYAQYLTGAARSTFGDVNEVHLAVHATVDASSGEVHLVRADGGDDPLLAAWDSIFPGLIDDADTMPAELATHLRYPGALFTAQTAMLGRYHVDTAELLFNGTLRWAASPGVVDTVGGDAPAESPAVDVVAGGFSTVRAYNPGDGANPGSTRDLLAAMVVGDHGGTGRVTVLETADGALGPVAAQSAIEADPDLAQDLTLLNANGSQVQFGPMTPVRTAAGIGWARSIVVVGTGGSAVPRLFGVAVVVDGDVTVAPTLTDALAEVQPAAE